MTLLTGRSPGSVPGAARPLRAVLDALEQGAVSVAELSVATGLSRDLVRDAIDHLVRLGRLTVKALPAGCPSGGGGCGGCLIAGRPAGCPATASSTASSTAPSATSSANRAGPVLVTITVR